MPRLPGTLILPVYSMYPPNNPPRITKIHTLTTQQEWLTGIASAEGNSKARGDPAFWESCMASWFVLAIVSGCILACFAGDWVRGLFEGEVCVDVGWCVCDRRGCVWTFVVILFLAGFEWWFVACCILTCVLSIVAVCRVLSVGYLLGWLRLYLAVRRYCLVLVWC